MSLHLARRVVVAGCAIVVALVSGCGGQIPAPASADGWRWESYGGIELRVPASWEYAIQEAPVCLHRRRPEVEPRWRQGVGGSGCGERIRYADSDQLPYLLLGPRDEQPGIARDGDGWVRETKRVAGVPVVVSLNDDAVREEIMGSIRPIGAEDVYGCPATHPNATHPLARPAPGAGLDSIGRVESVAICTYVLRELVRNSEVRLFAGSRLTGREARTAVAAIVAAPKGSGPNDPADCPRGEVDGDELTVLLVQGSRAEAEVVMRYSGCDHHGTDDGDVERQFTERVMDILRAGPHRPERLNGSMASLLFGAEPSK